MAPDITTGMAVDVPPAMQEMSGVSSRNASKLDTDILNDEHHEHLPAPLEGEHDVLDTPRLLQPQLCADSQTPRHRQEKIRHPAIIQIFEETMPYFIPSFIIVKVLQGN
jgi:hypothetical protein